MTKSASPRQNHHHNLGGLVYSRPLHLSDTTIAILLSVRFPYLAIFLCLWLPALGALEGRVEPPAGVPPESIRVLGHGASFSDVENDWNPAPVVAVRPDGTFPLDGWTTAPLQLEFTGPGVRRARFPFPETDGATRPVFELDPGSVMEVRIADSQDHPIPGALIGPIIPGTDAPANVEDLSYPFFVRADEQGVARIDGLLPATSYELPVYAEGYQRVRRQFPPGAPAYIILKEGGGYLAGQAVLEGTLEEVADLKVMLTGGPSRLYIARRTDNKGRFRFAGLPPGDYQLAAVPENVEISRPYEFTAPKRQGLDNIILPVRMGVRISGIVADVETGEGLPSVSVRLPGRATTTNRLGQFEFREVTGPWPQRVVLNKTNYLFQPEDQNLSQYPFNGYRGDDIDDVTLLMRRERYLDLSLIFQEEDSSSAAGIVEIWGPLEDSDEIIRQRVSRHRESLPLKSAGTRAVVYRGAGGFVSNLSFIETGAEQTTTTLSLQPGDPARLDVSLAWKEPEAEGAPRYRFELLSDHPLRPVPIADEQSNPQGRISFDRLPPGVYTANFHRQEGALYLSESVELKRGETVTLERSVSQGKVFAGRTVDEAGEIVRGVSISLYGRTPEGESLHLQVSSGRDGEFQAEGFGGEFLDKIIVNHSQYAALNLEDIALPQSNYELTLPKRAGIQVTLNAGAGALASASAMVLIARDRPAAEGLTQRFYEFDASEPFAGEPTVTVYPKSSGLLRVAAKAGAEWAVSPPFQWDSAQEGREITLNPGHRGALTVTLDGLPPGEEPEIVLVNTTLPDSAGLAEFTPESINGESARFSRLPSGNYFLLATTESGAAAAQNNIDITAGEQSISLSFAAAEAEIRGVVRSGGEPKPGAQVTLRFGDVPEAEALLAETTGSDGAFSFFPLPARRDYLLDIELAGGATSQRMIRQGEFVDGLWSGEITVEEAVAVTLLPPAELAETLASGGPPIILQPLLGGAGAMVMPQEIGNAVMLAPGEYLVMWGERQLGTAVLEPGEDSLAIPGP